MEGTLTRQTSPNDVTQNVSSDIKSVKGLVKELEEYVHKRKEKLRESLKTANKERDKVIEEIRGFRTELNTILDEAEETILIEVDQIHKANVALLKKFEDDCTYVDKEMSRLVEYLNKHQNSSVHLLEATELAVKGLKENDQKCVELIDQIKSYRFEANDKMIKLAMNRHGLLGKVIRRDPSELNVKAPNEEKCHIRGATLISSEEILIADSYNKSLKILNVSEKRVTSIYNLPAEPWDVTPIVPGKAAVTIPTKGLIFFLKTDGGLEKSHCLKVRNNCKGIDHRNGELAVSFTDPPAIQVMDLKGEIRNEIAMTEILSTPDYLTFDSSGETIFVSDFNRHAVFEITKTGQLKKTLRHADLKYPRGLTVTNMGDVMICSQGTGQLVAFNKTTGVVRKVDKVQVKQPLTVAVNEEKRTVYICEFYPDCNYMKVVQW